MSSYEIKSGDTLGAIAKTFGTTVKELARTNKIANPDKIRAGARIVVPEQEQTLMQQAQSFMGMEPEKKEAPVIEKSFFISPSRKRATSITYKCTSVRI